MRVMASVITIAVACVSATAAQGSVSRPNVLFIMSDDHTTQAIGAYGSRLAKLNPTPVIDSLAKNGMRFDRVFCNNAICSPSRASIITGQYSQRNGVTTIGGSITADKQYLPIEMKQAGYQTAMIGKWHLEAEPGAFDYYCVLERQGKYVDPDFRIRGDKPWPGNMITKKGMHSSDAITNISLEWLKNGRDKKKPFFLMHHFKAPHDMFTNAHRYDTYLEDTKIPEPTNLHTRPDGSVGSRGLGSGLGKKAPWFLGRRLKVPENLEEKEYVEECYQRYLKRYLRCVKGIDDNIKRLLDYLESTGELDNTIIMYTGDQGYFLGEHDLMDKRWMYEEAMRMPFIVHWPAQLKKEQQNDWLINNTDFAPTILELAGVSKTPDYMQGHSFASALKGEAKPADWRKVTYYRYWMHMNHKLAVPGHFGIRSDRYKLIFFYGSQPNGPPKNPVFACTPAAWEFYDLEADPKEMNNLYKNPEYRQIIDLMKTQLKETREALDETDENYPKVQRIIDANWSN